MMPPLRIAHLGSSGSFSEQAARLHACRVGRVPDVLGAPSPKEVLEHLASGAVERAVLPIANTTGGLVWPSLAALGRSATELVDEIVLPVRFVLLARPGTELAAIESVASHPQAFRQCARTLARLLPERSERAWSDTASAARDLAAGLLSGQTAVLASPPAGVRYGLATLALDVQDEPDNRTFFAVLGRAREATIE